MCTGTFKLHMYLYLHSPLPPIHLHTPTNPNFQFHLKDKFQKKKITSLNLSKMHFLAICTGLILSLIQIANSIASPIGTKEANSSAAPVYLPNPPLHYLPFHWLRPNTTISEPTLRMQSIVVRPTPITTAAVELRPVPYETVTQTSHVTMSDSS